MIVQDVMQSKVVVATPDMGLAELTKLLQQRGIRHLPVLDRGALVGIISDRDLKAAIASMATGESRTDAPSTIARLTAADIMTRTVVTIGPMFPVEEAAQTMVSKRISALPVTEAGQLTGIITETDVLQLFIRAIGVTEPSSRIDVTLDDEPHALNRVVQAVERAGALIASVMTLKSPVSEMKEAVIRVATINPGPAIKALENEGFSVRAA